MARQGYQACLESVLFVLRGRFTCHEARMQCHKALQQKLFLPGPKGAEPSFGQRHDIALRRQENLPTAMVQCGLEIWIAEKSCLIPSHLDPAIIQHRLLRDKSALPVQKFSEIRWFVRGRAAQQSAKEAHQKANP
jgi:hypothetical protein